MQVIDDDSGSEVEVLEPETKNSAEEKKQEPPAKRAKVDDSEAATSEQGASLPDPLSSKQIHDAVRFLRLSSAPVRASNLCTQIGAWPKQLDLPDYPWSLQEFAEGDNEDPFVVLTKDEAAVNRILLSVTPGVEVLEESKVSEVVDALRQRDGQMLVHALCGLTKVKPLQLRGESWPWVIKASPAGDYWVRLCEQADAPFPRGTSLPGMSVCPVGILDIPATEGKLGSQPKAGGGKVALTPGLQSLDGSAPPGPAAPAVPKIMPALKLLPAAKPLPTAAEPKGKGSGKLLGSKGKGKDNMQSMPGDWHCPACGDLQFARNKVCRRCGVLKPVEDPLPAAPATMPSHTLTTQQASSAAFLAAATNPAATSMAALNPLLAMNPMLAGGLLGGGCQFGNPLMNPLMAQFNPLLAAAQNSLMAAAQNPLMAAAQNPLMAAAQNPMAAALGLPGLLGLQGLQGLQGLSGLPTAMPDQSMMAAAALGGIPGMGMSFPGAAPVVPQASQADMMAQAMGGWVCAGCQSPQYAHNAYCRVCGAQNLRV